MRKTLALLLLAMVIFGLVYLWATENMEPYHVVLVTSFPDRVTATFWFPVNLPVDICGTYSFDRWVLYISLLEANYDHLY